MWVFALQKRLRGLVSQKRSGLVAGLCLGEAPRYKVITLKYCVEGNAPPASECMHSGSAPYSHSWPRFPLPLPLSVSGGRKNKPIKYQIVVVNRSLSRMKKLAWLERERNESEGRHLFAASSRNLRENRIGCCLRYKRHGVGGKFGD